MHKKNLTFGFSLRKCDFQNVTKKCDESVCHGINSKVKKFRICIGLEIRKLNANKQKFASQN